MHKKLEKDVRVFNVRDFGAKGDGQQMDTEAIQAAIEACACNHGGTVFFPAGVYLSGAIFLKNNVTICLTAEAKLLGSTNTEDYYEASLGDLGLDFSSSFIYAKNAKNIRIIGEGIIDGQGSAFPCGAENFNFEDMDRAEVAQSNPRPLLMRFQECEKISLEDITFQNGASMVMHCEKSKDIKITGIKIHNRANQNNDGLDFTACENVFISNCDLSCGDDAIPIFTSAKNFVITNCIISSRWAGIRIGPFSTGTFKNIAVSNCVIYNTYGAAIKIQLVEGGLMENISFDSLVMDNVTGPISIRLAGWLGWRHEREESLPIGKLRNIRFSNIRARVADNSYPMEHEGPRTKGEEKSCINITGLEGHNVENITISNVHITFPGGGTIEEANRMDIPELKDNYPEYHMFGVLPAYGLYARHVSGLTIENSRFDLADSDFRPAVVCDDVEDLELCNFRAKGNLEAESLIRLRQGRDVFVHGCRVLNEVKAFLKIEGQKSKAIMIKNNDLHKAKVPVIKTDDTKDMAIS